MTKEWNRAQIQHALAPIVDQTLGAMALPYDAPHVRRTIRSLLRIAATRAIEAGCPPDAWLSMTIEAFNAELSATPCTCGQCPDSSAN